VISDQSELGDRRTMNSFLPFAGSWVSSRLPFIWLFQQTTSRHRAAFVLLENREYRDNAPILCGRLLAGDSALACASI